MLVTLSGIVTLVRLLQPLNADLPMLVTPSGISRFATNFSFKYRLCAYIRGLDVSAFTTASGLYTSKFILHQAAMSVISTLARFVQPLNA